MNRIKVLSILILSGAIMSVTAQPAQAHNKHWKEDHHRGYKVFGTHRHQSHHPHSYGNISFRLPRGFISVTVGGEAYHYYDGVYYRKAHNGYVVTPPPFGACIKRLPRGYTKIYIDGRPYYTYNEIYYSVGNYKNFLTAKKLLPTQQRRYDVLISSKYFKGK